MEDEKKNEETNEENEKALNQSTKKEESKVNKKNLIFRIKL